MTEQQEGFSIFGRIIQRDSYPELVQLAELTDASANRYAAVIGRLVTTGELGEMLHELIKMVEADGPLSGRRATNSNGLSIIADRYKYFSLVSLGEFKTFDPSGAEATGDQFLANFRNPIIFSNCGSEAIYFKRYRFDPPNGLAVFQVGCPLTFIGDQRIASGESCLFDDPRDVIELTTTDHDGMMVAVTTLRFRESDLIWMFDRAAMSSVRAVSASHAATRAELLLEMLDTAGYTPASQVFRAQLDSPKHFIRWRSVRSLLKLSPKDGVDALRRCVDDPHPHIRKAAAQTLKNLSDRGLLEGANV